LEDRAHLGITKVGLAFVLVAVVAVAGIAAYVASTPPSASTTSRSTSSVGRVSAPALAIGMSPGSPLIAPGQTQNYSSVMVSSTDGEALTGTLTVRAFAPAGLSAVLNETSVSLANNPQSIPVVLKAEPSLPPGKYQVTIETSSADIAAQNQTYTIDVVPALVIMQDLAFHPQNITVPVGTSVTWINLDSTIGCCDPGNHDVSFLAGANDTSPVMTRLDTWSYSFDAAGVVEYYCTIHSFMKGQVTVTG